jgi:hypothetical protein
LEHALGGDTAAMSLIERWKERRRQKEAEKHAMSEMARVEDAPLHEPSEVKLSQMRD